MRDFSASVLEPFGLRAKRVTKAYGAFICDTNQGVVLVKEAAEPEEVLWFAHGIKEHLAQKGFGCTDRYLMNGEGEVRAELEGDAYTVRRWMRTEEVKLTEKECPLRLAAMLGQMHRAAKGFEAPAKSRRVNRCHDWPQQIYKDTRKIQSCSKMLRKNGRYTEFDLMVLECMPEMLEQLEEAQSFFLSEAYVRLADRADGEKVFGHGSYSDHTALLGRGQSMITDFEKSCYMIPVADLVMLLERALRKNAWNEKLGLLMLENYDRWCPLDSEQKQMVKALMRYPTRFCKLCSEAYQIKRNWMPISYKRKMEEWRAQQSDRKVFIKQLEHVLR